MPNPSSILIQGGWTLDPSIHHKPVAQDLLIEDGKILAIDDPGKIPSQKAARVIHLGQLGQLDPLGNPRAIRSPLAERPTHSLKKPKCTSTDPMAHKIWVLPGLIDVHVHLREPGLEYKETIATGTLAAVAGGFTSVACMANTRPVNDQACVTAFIREKAKAEGHCRVFPIGAVSQGLKGETLAEIGGMVQEGAKALSDDGMPVMNSALMRRAMDYSRAFRIPMISHAEDANLVGQGVMNEGITSYELGLQGIPTAAEEILVARDIALCRLTRAPLHIAHISTAIALRHIQRAKEDGLPVTAEVSPHHLFLTEEHLRGYDTCFKMAPPLRTQSDVDALRQGLAEGWIDIIATDHAPHSQDEKAVEFNQAANGIIGLQTAVPLTLQLVHEGILSPHRWVESLTLRPARLLNIPHGTLRVGQEADLTLLNPEQEWTFTTDQIVSRSQNSPFLNRKFRGKVLATLVKGEVVWEPILAS